MSYIKIQKRMKKQRMIQTLNNKMFKINREKMLN